MLKKSVTQTGYFFSMSNVLEVWDMFVLSRLTYSASVQKNPILKKRNSFILTGQYSMQWYTYQVQVCLYRIHSVVAGWNTVWSIQSERTRIELSFIHLAQMAAMISAHLLMYVLYWLYCNRLIVDWARFKILWQLYLRTLPKKYFNFAIPVHQKCTVLCCTGHVIRNRT